MLCCSVCIHVSQVFILIIGNDIRHIRTSIIVPYLSSVTSTVAVSLIVATYIDPRAHTLILNS